MIKLRLERKARCKAEQEDGRENTGGTKKMSKKGKLSKGALYMLYQYWTTEKRRT